MDDEVSLMRLEGLADAPDHAVALAARNLAAQGRPLNLEALHDAVMLARRRVHRRILPPTQRLLGTIGMPSDGLVRRIITSASEVRQSAGLHRPGGSLPLPFSVDRDGHMFAVDSNGWTPPQAKRDYIKPTTRLLFTIQSILEGHRMEAKVKYSGRFYMHCGWAECAACRQPLAWFVDAPDRASARACPETFGPTPATMYHRRPSVRCPRPDCFCEPMKIW